MPQDFNLSDIYASLSGSEMQGPRQMPDMPTMGPQVQPTNLMNQPSADNGGLPAAVSTANAWGVEAKKREVEQQAVAQLQMSVDPINGKVDIKDMPSFLMNEIMGKYKAFNQIQDNYQRKVAEKQAELAYQKAHPWANALATIAGSLAANDPNPITRGLGQAAQQLNPTRAQLQAQQMQLLQGQAQAAGQGLQAAEGMARINSQSAKQAQDAEMDRQKLGMDRQRLGLEERRVKLSEGSTAEKATAAKLDDERAFNTKWDDRASKRLFDPKTFVSEYKKLFPQATQAEIDEQLQGKQSLQKAATALAKEVGNEKANEYAQRQKANHDYFLQKNKITHEQDMEKAKARIKEQNPKATAAQLKSIADGVEAEVLIGNLRAGLKSHPGMFGPMWLDPRSSYKRMVDPIFDDAASQLTADFVHATPIMVKLLGEGARGYAQNQRQWVESKVPKLTDTIERNEGKIAFMEGLLAAKKKGDEAMRAYVRQYDKTPPSQLIAPVAAAPKVVNVTMEDLQKAMEAQK